MLTPWQSYRLDLQRAPQRFWTALGRIQAYAETLTRSPLGPAAMARLTREKHAEAARATVAAEFGPDILRHTGGSDLAAAVGALYDEADRRPDAPLTAQTFCRDNDMAGDIAQAVALTQLTLLADHAGPGKAGPAAIAAASLADQFASPRSWSKLNQFCDWLNGHEFLPPPGEEFQNAFIRAMAAHLFLLLLRPFNHSAEISARLAGYRVLRAAGLPGIAAHLPAIHFAATADAYKELTEEAVEAGSATIAFSVYAADGMARGMRDLVGALGAAQEEGAWRDALAQAFDGRNRAGDRRRRLLIDDLAAQGGPVRIGALRYLSPRLAEAYAGKSEKTLSRDVKWLESRGLIERSLRGVRARREAVYVHAGARAA